MKFFKPYYKKFFIKKQMNVITIIDRKMRISLPIQIDKDTIIQNVILNDIAPYIFPGKFELLDKYGKAADSRKKFLSVVWPEDGIHIKPLPTTDEEYESLYEPVFRAAEKWIIDKISTIDGFVAWGFGYPYELRSVQDREELHNIGYIIYVMKEKASNFYHIPDVFQDPQKRGIIPLHIQYLKNKFF